MDNRYKGSKNLYGIYYSRRIVLRGGAVSSPVRLTIYPKLLVLGVFKSLEALKILNGEGIKFVFNHSTCIRCFPTLRE